MPINLGSFEHENWKVIGIWSYNSQILLYFNLTD